MSSPLKLVPREEAHARPAESLRVLLVEHSVTDAELWVHALEHGRFCVRADVVGTPQEFSARLAEQSYDIVLADYRLPNWTGMDALAALREGGYDIPLILVTGSLGDERAIECLRQGAADYILKGNLARLPLAVRRALDEKSARADRARAEALIRKLSLAVDQSPASVIITDTDGTIEYVNQRFTQVTGYTAEEAIGHSPRVLKSGGTPQGVYADMWQALADGLMWRGEMLNRKKNGELYWDSVSISPVRDAGENITHFVATQEDVTERRHAEQAIREREERFSQIADNIKEVFFVMDSEYLETLYISPAYEAIWGRSCRSLYENPRSFTDAIPVEDRGPLLASIARNQAGEDAGEIEFRVIQPSGHVRWVLSHAVPVRDEQGKVYRISGVALDITERRQAEEALRESETRFRQLAENSKAMFFISDVATDHMIYLSPAYEEIWGRSCESGCATPGAWLEGVHHDDRERLRAAERETGTRPATWEVFRVVRPDGSMRWVRSRAFPVRDAEGRLYRVVGIAEDFTELRRTEDQLHQSQKMEAVGQLAGGVAHDFNNLLTVITSYADLLFEDFNPTDPRRDDLEQIRKAASGAAALTRQLLAFSRQQVIEPRVVTLEDVVADAEKMLRRLIGEDIELVTVLSKAPSRVMIDPGQLEQVIMNLAVNARDAMPTGGTLTIETTPVSVDDAYVLTHATTQTGRFAMLAMTDTGIGMDEQTGTRIFEPFFTTKELGKGTGLGLATVYGIVKQSAGFIWVYSEPGRGSTFKIYLPVTDQLAAREPGTPGVERMSRGTETVLLVEDAAAVRHAVRQSLARFGYKVLEAPSGAAALAIALKRKGPIHLLLSDVVMPEMSGRRLAEQFAELRPDAKVLYMSGYTDDAVLRHGVLRPGVAYLQKPFSPETLANKVREILDSGRDS